MLLPSYFAGPIIIEAAELEGDLIYLRVRTETGQLEELALSQDELERALEAHVAEESYVVPANGQFLLVETERIRLAYT